MDKITLIVIGAYMLTALFAIIYAAATSVILAMIHGRHCSPGCVCEHYRKN